MYELSNGQQLYELPSFYSPHEPPNVLFLPGSRQFITIWGGPSSKKLQPSRHLALYDSRNGERLGEFLSRYGAAQPELSPDGRWLVAETWHTLGFQLWDVEKRQPLFKLHPKMPRWRWLAVDLLRFSPNGKWLVAANSKHGLLAAYEINP